MASMSPQEGSPTPRNTPNLRITPDALAHFEGQQENITSHSRRRTYDLFDPDDDVTDHEVDPDDDRNEDLSEK